MRRTLKLVLLSLVVMRGLVYKYEIQSIKKLQDFIGIKTDTIPTLNIEPIEKDSEDYKEIETIKAQNNPKYSLDEVKAQLGL